MRTDFTPAEIDAMPRLDRMNVRVRARAFEVGEPVFYYDSGGEMWSVTETEVGFAKRLYRL